MVGAHPRHKKEACTGEEDVAAELISIYEPFVMLSKIPTTQRDFSNLSILFLYQKTSQRLGIVAHTCK